MEESRQDFWHATATATRLDRVSDESHHISLTKDVVGTASAQITLTSLAAAGSDDILPYQQLTDLERGSLHRLLSTRPRDVKIEPLLRTVWKRILTTVCSPAVTEKHLTAACNVLCIFLLSTFPIDTPVRQCDQERWRDAFGALQRTFDAGKTKPALQVLDTLLRGTNRSQDSASTSNLLQKAVQDMTEIVVLGVPTSRLKQALTILAHFLQRGGVTIDILSHKVGVFVSHKKSEWRVRLAERGFLELQNLDGLTCLCLSIWFAMNAQDTRSAAKKLFTRVCRHQAQAGAHGLATVRDGMEIYIASSAVELDDFANDVLPSIFETAEEFESFVASFSLPVSDRVLLLYLATLQVGRFKGFIAETDTYTKYLSSTVIDTEVSQPASVAVTALLGHSNTLVRIASYKLLTWSSTSTSPVPQDHLESIVGCYIYLHDEGDAHYRGEIHNISKHFLKRLRDSSLGLQRQGCPISRYAEFCRELLRVVFGELSPSASYQRHIMALRTFNALLEEFHGQPLLHVSIQRQQTSHFNTLLTLLFDPYDDVREAAAAAVRLCLREEAVEVARKAEIINGPHIFGRLDQMAASSCRGDHADGLGRLYGLVASADLVESFSGRLEPFLFQSASIELPTSFPLHGLLLAMTYCMNQINSTLHLRKRALSICKRVWILVHDHLCVDSPEFSSENANGETDTGPKDVLAFAWRALRDSSLLMNAAVHKLDAHELYRSAGDLCFEQLTRLRHRGAFSTVAQTFTAICQAVARSSNLQTRHLRHLWHESAVEQIYLQADRLTRRSAGLPALVASTLDASDAPAMQLFVSSFIMLASDTTMPNGDRSGELPQVHAFNCLREIVINARFRSSTEPFVLQLLQLASRKLVSEIWAVRNCSLMLFRACMTRIEHSSSNGSAYQSDPQAACSEQPLLQLVYDLLQPSSAKSCRGDEREVLTEVSPETVFTAMDLIAHINSTIDSNSRLWHLLRPHLGNGIWALRERAAGLLVLYSQDKDDILTIVECVQDLDVIQTANEVHGLLLFCRNMVRKGWEKCYHLEDSIKRLRRLKPIISPLARLAGDLSAHPINRAAAFDILNDLIREWDNTSCLQDTGLDAIFTFTTPTERPLNEYHPVLRRAYVLPELYEMFIAEASNHDTISLFKGLVSQLFACDHDALKGVLVELYSIETAMEEGVSETICSVVTSHSCPEDLAATAMDLLADAILRTFQNTTSEQLAKLQSVVENVKPNSRSVFKAKIKLQARLLGSQSGLNDSPNYAASCFSAWLLTLRLAVRDEIDLSVRLNAVESISTYVQLATKQTQKLDFLNNLDFLLIVYDLTQDDDEEVRRIVSQVVSTLLSPRVSDHPALCSLATTEILVRHITGLHRSNPRLVKVACQRLLNTDRDAIRFCRRYTISSTVAAIRHKKNELFVEEKQNLYVDEVRDAKVWFHVLQSTGVQDLPLTMSNAIKEWVEDGLQYLATSISGDRATAFPPGLTFDPEISVLCVRAVLLAHTFRSGREDCGLQQALTSFRSAAVRVDVQEGINEALQMALP